MGYDRIDPIIKGNRKWTADAIRWADVYSDASTTEYERRVFEEAATFGLKSGITVPLRGPAGRFALPWDRDFQNRTTTYLQLAAIHFHLAIAKLSNFSVGQEVPEPSRREKECIPWVARGKSSWDIGMIMNISENTVNFHIKSVMRKLDVSSRNCCCYESSSSGNHRIVKQEIRAWLYLGTVRCRCSTPFTFSSDLHFPEVSAFKLASDRGSSDGEKHTRPSDLQKSTH